MLYSLHALLSTYSVTVSENSIAKKQFFVTFTRLAVDKDFYLNKEGHQGFCLNKEGFAAVRHNFARRLQSDAGNTGPERWSRVLTEEGAEYETSG